MQARAKTVRPLTSTRAANRGDACFSAVDRCQSIACVGTEPVPQTRNRAPCASNPGSGESISKIDPQSVAKGKHGGARANAGGARAGAGRKPKMAPPVLVDTEERWYCVRTSFHGEIRTDLDIRDLGFSVFAPSLWRPPARARRDRNGVLRPARPARLVPLFPR